jgi:hypothetical protein
MLTVSIDSKNAATTNLKKYIKVNRKWRFAPVMMRNGAPH